jgi:hypothetical protein
MVHRPQGDIAVDFLKDEGFSHWAYCTWKHSSCPYLFLRDVDHTSRNLYTDFTDTSQAGIDEAEVTLFFGQGLRKGKRGSFDHAWKDVTRLGKDTAQSNTREHIPKRRG